MAGWPPGYPSRGEWAFRNVRREFMFWPTLDEIKITQEWPDVVATFSCEVVDRGEGYEFGVDDEVRALFRGGRIFAGHLTTVTEDRSDEGGPRIWRLEASDYTSKLGDALIRQQEQRQKESALRRIRWILSYLDHAWHLDGRDLDIPDEDVERQDMFGMTVAEALDSVANEMGLRYWIDPDNVLHVHKAHTITAPFGLDNEDPDYSSTFPFREATYQKGGVDRRNAVLVEPEERKDSRWSVAEANIADYRWGDSTGRRELFVSAEEIRTARAAERHGDTMVQRTKVPEGEAKVICHEPGIYAGMTVAYREALWDRSQSMRVVGVTITAVDPHDEDDEAYLRSELVLNNKPKRRSPKAGRTGPPGSGGQTPDTTARVLDDFSRVVTPPVPTEGDAVSYGWEYADLTYGQQHGDAPWFTYGAEYGPDLTMHGTPVGIFAVAGGFNHGWPSVPCGIGFGAWSDWREVESWAKLTISAVPDGAVGVYVTVSAGGYTGAAGAVEVRESSGPPTKPHDGALLGRIEGASSLTVFAPVSGPGTLWIGLCAGWYPDYGIYGQGWRCVGNPVNPRWSGELNSGMALSVGWDAKVWAMAAPPGDLGMTLTPGGQGPWTWEQTGTEGSPTWGMADGSLYVEGTGGVSLMLQGEGADEGEPYGIWSEVKAGVEVDFIASDLTGGTIELTMTGQGRKAVVTLDIGAGTVTAAGPSSTDTGAVSLTAGTRYTLSMDTRAGEVRAKVWESSGVEPAEWAAIAALDETEDDGDSLTVRVIAASGQTISLPEMRTMASGDVGQSIVNERIGATDGLSDTFLTRHPYRAGTLTAKVETGDVPPSVEQVGSLFRLDYLPTEGMMVRADYVVAGDET